MNQKRIVALDIGDVWTGVAHTDPSQIICTPYENWKTKDLIKSLKDYFREYSIERVVVGVPITMKGTDSSQTEVVYKKINELKDIFSEHSFDIQDERLSSQMAQTCIRSLCLPRKKYIQTKKQDHSRAACIILENYIEKYKNKI